MEGLINESAFMKVMLEEIRMDLIKSGMMEIFKQGSQSFERERPSTKTYSTLVQKYATVQKQLIDLLPTEEKKKEKDELADFMQKSRNLKNKC